MENALNNSQNALNNSMVKRKKKKEKNPYHPVSQRRQYLDWQIKQAGA